MSEVIALGERVRLRDKKVLGSSEWTVVGVRDTKRGRFYDLESVGPWSGETYRSSVRRGEVEI